MRWKPELYAIVGNLCGIFCFPPHCEANSQGHCKRDNWVINVFAHTGIYYQCEFFVSKKESQMPKDRSPITDEMRAEAIGDLPCKPSVTLRDFVRYKPMHGALAIIVRNDSCGGVFRGHCDIWLGQVEDGKPVVYQVLASDCEPLDQKDIPIGKSAAELKEDVQLVQVIVREE